MKINLKKQVGKLTGVFFSGRNKDTVFSCQLTEDSLKVARFSLSQAKVRELSGRESLNIAGLDDKMITEKAAECFKKLGFQGNPVIVCLPRAKATCRRLLVPASTPQEISNIVALQASRYLPYPAEELITGFQAISVDKTGYSDISLAIVHRDTVSRYSHIFSGFKPESFSVALSSWGLVNFLNRLKPGYNDPAMIVDFDANQAELVVCSARKLLFSRYFKLDRSRPDWKAMLSSEVSKSREAYIKEPGAQAVSRIFATGARDIMAEAVAELKNSQKEEVEELVYAKDDSADRSFCALAGLGFEGVDEHLNLILPAAKQEARKSSLRNESVRIGSFIAAIILILSLSIAKGLNNKSLYLGRLKAEVARASKEARPLEEIDRRMKLILAGAQRKPTNLEILYELHRLMPQNVSLVSLAVGSEGKEVVMRGQAQGLDLVFNLVSQLEKTAAFKPYNIKVRYATKRKTAQGELTDFEISCSRK